MFISCLDQYLAVTITQRKSLSPQVPRAVDSKALLPHRNDSKKPGHHREDEAGKNKSGYNSYFIGDNATSGKEEHDNDIKYTYEYNDCDGDDDDPITDTEQDLLYCTSVEDEVRRLAW